MTTSILPSPSVELFELIRYGALEDVVEFLKSNPKSAKKLDWDGEPALHAAMRHSDDTALALCEVLLHFGASLSEQWDRTPLDIAACEGKERCVEFFLKAGIPVNKLNPAGNLDYPAIAYAVMNGQLGVAKKLYASGADLRSSERHGFSLLQSVMMCEPGGAEEMIQWLVEMGLSLDEKDNNGKIPEDHLNEDSSLRLFVKGIRQAVIEKKALEGILCPLNHEEPTKGSPALLKQQKANSLEAVMSLPDSKIPSECSFKIKGDKAPERVVRGKRSL